MKKILLIFFLFLSFTSVHAQSFYVDTTRFVGGDGSCGWAEATYSIPTRDGGILFVGTTDCYAGGGAIPPNFPGGAGAGHVLIGKLDSNMNISWVKVYGGSTLDIANSAVQTSDGGYAVLAYTQSDDSDVSGNHGLGDFWLVRIDSLGNLLWQQCYGGPSDEEPFSIALTPGNGFIMLGISNGSGDEVPTHYGTQFNENWFVVKTDSVGNMQWSKTIGGTGQGEDLGEQGHGSILYADNGYYLVSATNSTDHDCTDTCWHPGVNTGDDYYVFRLDTAGNILWDSSYGGSNSEVAYQAIWDNRDSSIVINGFTGSNDYMVTGFHGETDFWVIKINKNGKLLWERCLGGSNTDQGSSICSAPFGYAAFGSAFPGNIGEQDGWIFSLDTFGDTLSNKQFGGTNYENPYSIIPFKNSFAATGGSQSFGFTEGINIGQLPNPQDCAFISYLDSWPLSIKNISMQSPRLQVYPNPANEYITILLPVGTGYIQISNCIGESIFAENIKQQQSIYINTAGWAKGLYIAKWQGENGVVLTNKFVKN